MLLGASQVRTKIDKFSFPSVTSSPKFTRFLRRKVAYIKDNYLSARDS